MPKAVFLDIRLPGTSGLSLLKKLKAIPAFSLIPAFILSTSFAAGEINTAMEARAKAFMMKTDSLAELINFLSDALL